MTRAPLTSTEALRVVLALLLAGLGWGVAALLASGRPVPPWVECGERWMAAFALGLAVTVLTGLHVLPPRYRK